MKQLFTAALLSVLFFSCSDTATQTESATATDQQLAPGQDVGTEPMGMDETAPMGESATSATYFDAALNDLEATRMATAADNLQLGISALEQEGVSLQDSAHQELKTVIEQLENITDRVRTGEITDQTEIKQLIDRAEMMVQE